MIWIDLTDEEIQWAKDHANKISKAKGIKDTKNSKNFFKDKPAWHRSFVGACGEKAYSKFSNQPINEEIYDKYTGDDGYDFPDGTNVKCSDYKDEPNLLFPKDQWDRKPHTDSYVMSWLVLKEKKVGLIGRVSREKADRVKQDWKRGKRCPTWVIPKYYLIGGL